MAGSGTWTAQNKVLPGVYINFTSNAGTRSTDTRTGTVTTAQLLSWGPAAEVMEITPETDTTKLTGYPLTDSNNLFLQQMFLGTNRSSGASKVLLYRLPATGWAKASVTTGNLTATAKYYGARGNDITIVITANLDGTTFNVSTLLDGVAVDVQTSCATVADLVNNDWVAFTGEGALAATAGAPLVDGSDGTSSSVTALSDFLTAIEPYKFNILCCDLDDSTVRGAAEAFIRAQNEQNGQYCQLVECNGTSPDSRYVVNVTTGATLADETELTAAKVTHWVSGALAGASFNQSLTNATFPGAADTDLMTVTEQAEALNSGEFILAEDNGRVYIVQDINSLTTYNSDITEVYRYNRTMRLCNKIANDLFTDFSENYIGIVNNNSAGRAQFKSSVVGYLLDVQNSNGIQNFTADDVAVEAGESIDAVVVNLAVQPVGTVEKIYMTISMNA